MATLTGQTIASSYEQLLHVDRDGGGNSTTLVSIKDGDNGTTFGFQISTNALMMTSTNQLQFGDTGTYIYQSADGVLDLVSDTEIEINATTIDINGAVDISGNTTIGGDLTVNGTSTYINSTTLQIDDKLIELAHSPSGSEGDDSAVDGGGITLKSSDSDKTILWENDDDSWHFNQGINITSGNLVVAGNIDLEGDIDVNGTANLDNTDIDGTLTQDAGNVVFNEDSGDYDFRIESNGNANMFFVDGGNDVIGIGTNSPDTGHLLTLKTSSTGGDWIKGEQSDGGQGWRIGADSGDDAFFELQKADASQTILLSADGDSHFSGGNVGIGTTSPDQLLHVKATSGNVYGKIEATGSNQAAGLYLIGHSGDESRLYFGDEGSSNIGRVVYAHGDNSMQFTTNSSERMRITSDGDIGIGVTAPRISTAWGSTNSKYLTVTNGSTGPGILTLSADRSGTGQGIGRIEFANANNADASNNDADGKTIASITSNLITSDSNSGDDSGGEIQIHTKPEAGSLAEAMRITSAGVLDTKYGIKLTSGGSAADNFLYHHSNNYVYLTGGTAGLALKGKNSDDANIYLGVASQNIELVTNNTTRMKLDNNSRISLSNNDGGSTSGVDSTTGNTIFGYLAGAAVDSDVINNTIFGHKAGNALNAGDGNVIIGSQAGDALTTGLNNTFVGREAGSTTTDVDLSVAVGYGAGNADMTADANGTVCIGSVSGNAITSGIGNTAVGYYALAVEDDGDRNTAIGYQALTSQTGTSGAVGNTAIGWKVGYSTTKGRFNTIVGEQALYTEDVGDHSTAIGYQTMYSQNSDSDNEDTCNTGLGAYAGYYNVTGQENTWLGHRAGFGASGQSNSENTALGNRAMEDITTGGKNVAVGKYALNSMTTGHENVAIGRNAGVASENVGYAVIIGSDACAANMTNAADGTIAIGKGSLAALTSGERNLAIGYQSLQDLTDGDDNIMIGYQAGLDANSSGFLGNVGIGNYVFDGFGSTVTAAQNVAIGHQAMSGALTSAADDNVVIGYQAGTAITAGDNNVIIGSNAADELTTGGNNVVIGKQAMHNADGGENENTCIGSYAGDVIDGGNYNTIIGSVADPSTAAASNQTVIGYDATGQGNGTVTLGNASVTDVYMAQDSGATVHCSGINFPDTQAASGDANTLDDYEEGVHAVTLGGASFTMSSVKNSLQYTKIGRLVTLSGEISVTAVSSATGTFTISLPFTVADIDDLAERFQGTFSCQNINFSGDYLNIGSYAGQNTMSVQISNSNGAWTYLQASTFSSTSEFVVSVQYIT